MAITVQSVSSNSVLDAGNTTIAIDKPSSLAVGDLMIAIVSGAGGGGATWSSTGWTLDSSRTLTSTGTGTYDGFLYKTADSSDVAASSFTFTVSAAQSFRAGVILRLTGVNTATPNFAINSTLNVANGNPTFTNTITPEANSLLIFWVGQIQMAAGVSAYAIATSNPTWTERADLNQSTYNLAVATATRPESTGTGNSSVTSANSGGTGYSGGVMLGLKLQKVSSTTETVTSTDSIVKKPIRVFNETITNTDSTTNTKNKKWTNPSKNTTTWTNPNKS